MIWNRFANSISYDVNHYTRMPPALYLTQCFPFIPTPSLFILTQYFPVLLKSKTTPDECPLYDTKKSDVEAPLMLDLWEMQSTLLLPSLQDSLWLGVVVPDNVLFMGYIDMFPI